MKPAAKSMLTALALGLLVWAALAFALDRLLDFAAVTRHLRLAASAIAEVALRGFGVGCVREGTALVIGGGAFVVEVAEECSGVRTVLALAALSAGYGYLAERTWVRRIALVALALPLAVAANAVRILSVCLVASCVSERLAAGFYHDYSGYLVFAVAVLLLLAAAEAIARIAGPKSISSEREDGDGQG